MQSKSKRSRILVIGALVGSVLSIGVSAGAASAGSRTTQTNTDTTTVVINSDTTVKGVESMQMMSGIRW